MIGDKITITVPLLPPSVNHYVSHGAMITREGKARATHRKTKATLKWQADFGIFVRGQFVTGNRFAAHIAYRLGPGDRGDVDNFNKCLLDAAAACACLMSPEGKPKSDAWFKRKTVEILDSPAERAQGQQTQLTIEVIG